MLIIRFIWHYMLLAYQISFYRFEYCFTNTMLTLAQCNFPYNFCYLYIFTTSFTAFIRRFGENLTSRENDFACAKITMIFVYDSQDKWNCLVLSNIACMKLLTMDFCYKHVTWTNIYIQKKFRNYGMQSKWDQSNWLKCAKWTKIILYMRQVTLSWDTVSMEIKILNRKLSCKHCIIQLQSPTSKPTSCVL